jgi:hypothetical protein
MAIAPGTVGPGGAKFGAGAGGPNRYDFTQYGSGLWSVGIDPNAPDARAQADRVIANMKPAERAEVMAAVNRNQPGRGNRDAVVYGLDARQRDVARKIQKSNSFLDTTLGKVLGTVATIGAGFLPGGQFLAPAVGAGLGGAKGGLKGAVLGGLGGYAAGQGAGFLKGAAAKAGGAAAFKAAPGAFAKNVGGQAVSAAKQAVTQPFTVAKAGATKGAETALAGGAQKAAGGLGSPSLASLGESLYTPASLAPAGAAAAAPTGFLQSIPGLLKSGAQSAVSSLLQNPLQAGALGLAAMQAIKGPQLSTGEKTVAAQNQQTNALTNQLISRYQSGTLDPNDERAIDEWRRGSRAQVEQFFANAGIPNSTQKLDMLRDIDAKAIAMRDQVRQNYAGAAMSGANVSSNAALALGQLQNLGDAQAANALQGLLQAAALTAVPSSRGQTLPPGAV